LKDCFRSLSLSASLLKALDDEGYRTPTPIQRDAIPPILAGRDVLGCAQTGTGKTAAFALPLLERLAASMPKADAPRGGPRHPRVLVLAPTRELAIQIVESFATYGRHTSFRATAIFGGVNQFHQVKALERGVDILVATPGRLIDLMEQRLVTLTQVRALVLDEADRMLDMGFIMPIRRIERALSKDRQTLLFSATMPPEIRELANAFLRDPITVTVTPVASLAPKIEQALFRVSRDRKQSLLEHLLATETMPRAVVFTKTKHGADRVAKRLMQRGVKADAIHGNKAQNRRQRTLEAFRNGTLRVLVATDVAARGLDVDDVSHVINFDLSMEPEAHVHRIGRTGRAGATGIAISFCDDSEVDLLRDIERLTRMRLPQRPLPATLAAMPTVSAADHDDAPRESHGRPQRGDRGGRPGRPQRGNGERASQARSPKARSSSQGHRQGGNAPAPSFQAAPAQPRPNGMGARGRGRGRR
jgi:ATP-dependent RNA helicase RhlE